MSSVRNHNSIRRRRSCDALAEVDEVKPKVSRENDDITRPVYAVFDLPGLRFLQMRQGAASISSTARGFRGALEAPPVGYGTTGPCRSELLVHFIAQETCINDCYITSILQKSPRQYIFGHQ